VIAKSGPDQAAIKLSDLDKKIAPIVAMIDFASKIKSVRRSAFLKRR
jgi:hypothetical protein